MENSRNNDALHDVVAKETELSAASIEEIVEAAAEMRNEENDILNLKETVHVNPEAELIAETVETNIDAEQAIDVMANAVDTMPAMNIDITEADNEEAVEKATADLALNNAKDSFNLDDNDALQLLDVFKQMKQRSFKVYDNLPKKLQDIVNMIMENQKIPVKRREDLARAIISQMVKDAGVEQAFIDFEKSLDEALNIPSLMDLYSEHTRETMEVRIPEMIEKIKNDAPDKAAKLQEIKDAFTRAYTFSFAMNGYNTTIKKAIRRFDLEFKRSLDMLNYKNKESTFKMNDATEMPVALFKVLIKDPLEEVANLDDGVEPTELQKRLIDMAITEVDIKKFCILISKTCQNLNANDLIDAAYMYYMMRNIITLKLTQESKTMFAVELINNICDVITFIRNKEAGVNAANMDKSQSTTELHSSGSVNA